MKRKRYSRQFQRMAVERMRSSDNIGNLAKELGVGRRCLYKWQAKFDHLEPGEEAPRTSSHESSYRQQVHRLKRLLAEKTLEVDFFKGALQKVKAHPYIRLQQEFVYLAVILDGFSRKAVGWELDRTLAVRLPLTALEQAIAGRPGPGVVHHSDRGLQYVAVLRQHQMIPSMSRPANPYDNASCESFIKTLKREEIYANRYQDLGHMRVNIEEFIEQYYNRLRLHSALGYRSPEEFERQKEMSRVEESATSASLVFFTS